MTDFYAGREEPQAAPHVIQVPTFLRRAVPDVPEDIEDDVYAHLNDPNYDLRSLRSTRSSTSFELDDKKKSFAGDSIDYSSEADTESQLGTTTRGADSQAPLQESGFDDESPYPEVRAAVSNVDDPLMPVNTFRTWFLGIFYAIVVSGLNQFFSMRYPSVYLSGLVAQLTALPLGKLLEWALPTYRFNTFGYVWSLNPGPFNIKEHTIITVMANVVVNGAYATDVIATQRVFYGQNYGILYALLLCWSSQLIGYSYAGLLRRFLVWPNSMIWPGALVNAALFNTLHKNYGKRERKHISRERFFVLALAASFVWYWVPGYLFTALSIFNWVCWIAPNNAVVNQLFGTVSGLGMSVITLDWSMISFTTNPLVVPWWAQVNTMAAFVFFFWIVTPIVYYTNVWSSKFLPISSTDSYTNTGASYDSSQILTNGYFDLEKYRAYSPIFISSTFAISYGVSFAAFTAVIVHVFLWYRRDIVRQVFQNNLSRQKDVHSRLMAVYPEVPYYWYAGLFVVAFAVGIVACEKWDTGMTFWAYLLAILISLLLAVPTGMIQAITNQVVQLGTMIELIVGYALPGRPTAMMIFKTYGFISMNQAIQFSGDLKLGHYMKIPPRIMFIAQTLATFVSCAVVVLVQSWMFANIPDLCSHDQKDGFICAGTNTFATASLIWGGIGPQRIFGIGSIYNGLMYFFLAGALLPIPFYILARRYPHAIWRYINIPVFFNGVYFIPPASGINYSSWFAVGLVFQWFVRRRHFRWWMRYNYILAAALDSGVALAMVAIFFTIVYPRHGTIGLKTVQAWWGNNVYMNTLDAQGAPLAVVAEGEIFGPKSWS